MQVEATMVIETPTQLFGTREASTPSEYARAVYEATECGASTVFVTPRSEVVAADMTKRQDTMEWVCRHMVGVRHGSTVEGSEAEFKGRTLLFPFTLDELEATLQELEDQVDEAWKEANE